MRLVSEFFWPGLRTILMRFKLRLVGWSPPWPPNTKFRRFVILKMCARESCVPVCGCVRVRERHRMIYVVCVCVCVCAWGHEHAYVRASMCECAWMWVGVFQERERERVVVEWQEMRWAPESDNQTKIVNRRILRKNFTDGEKFFSQLSINNQERDARFLSFLWKQGNICSI